MAGPRWQLLLLGVLAACSATAAAAAAAAHGPLQEGEPTCDALDKVPAEQRCSFLRDKCPAESLVPYAQLYFCHVAHHNVVLRAAYLLAVCCLLPLAFCLLGDTAEFYIAPIMAHVSQAIPKMRPRFAGVTFVALGNGAPDLSANIAAISAGEVTLSAGALTGAAMFVQCVVAAELVALAGDAGIKCGGAMLRDVGVYGLAISSVLLAFALGRITRVFVAWAISLYVLYMLWVFVGDEWHQRGRPKPQLDPLAFRSLINRLASRGASEGAAAGTAGVRRSSGGGGASVAGRASFGGELEETLLPWVEAEEEEEQEEAAFGSYDGSRSAAGTLPGPPPAFEASVGAAASRPASFTGVMSTERHSTELSAVPGGSSSSAATPTGRHMSSRSRSGHSSRRASEPANSLRGSTSSSSGAAAAPWGALPDGGVRHASATLPGAAAQRGAGGWGASGQQQRLGVSMHPHVLSLGRQSIIDSKTYKQLVWADLADDEEEEARLEREIARQLIGGVGRSRATTGAGAGPSAGAYQPPALPGAQSGSPTQQQQQHLQRLRLPQQPGSPDAESGGYLSPFGSAGCRTGPNTPTHRGAADGADADAAHNKASPGWQQQQQPSSAHTQAVGDGFQQQQQQAELPPGGDDTWQQLQWQLTLGNSEEWLEAGPVVKLFRRVTFPLLLPAYLGQRLTIPFASSSGYSREWLIVALLCCPLALVTYLGLMTTVRAVLATCAVGIASAAAAAALTAWDAPGQMAVQGLGGRAAAVAPGVLAVLAFFSGVAWIDTIATEVVAVLTFLAGLAALPAGVVGLTLLAWGSSLGDFFGNRAMARAGHTSTAITACFAAPLFNMLISLAAGFSTYLHKLGASSVAVTLTPEVALGCVFLVGYNAAIIAVGRACGQRLPPWFRHFARAWYAAYFAAAVASGFYQQHRSSSSGVGG